MTPMASRTRGKVAVIIVSAAVFSVSQVAQASIVVHHKREGAGKEKIKLMKQDAILRKRYMDQIAFGPYIIFFG